MRYYHLGLLLLLCIGSSCRKNKKETITIHAEKAEKQIDKIINDFKIPGIAVAVVGTDGIIWQKTKGMANIEKKETVTDQTVFKLASISKPIIALSILKLQEEGKLNIDANVNNYLPFEIRNPKNPGKIITLRQLMTHTSGIVDTLYSREGLQLGFLEKDKDHPLPLADFIKKMLTPGGQFYHPDTFLDDRQETFYSYSNVGAALAAFIVEQVAKEGFDTYSSRQFFAPLNTRSLVWHLRGYSSQPFAMPYNKDQQAYGNYSTVDYCSGGLHSNLKDLAAFTRMLINNGMASGKQLISVKSLDEMKRIQFPAINPTQGLFLDKAHLGSSEIYGHSGTVMGGNSFLFIRPDTKRGVIIIVNCDLENETFAAINELLVDLFELN